MFLRNLRVLCYSLAVVMMGFYGKPILADEAGDLANEVANQKKVVAEEMNVIVQQHLALGKELYGKGEYDKALDEYNTVLDIDKDNKDAQSARMQCIGAIANKGNAAPLPVAATTTEQVAVHYQSITEASSKTEKEAGAIEAYREGLQAFKLNRKEEAVQKLKISCALNPDYVPSKRLLKKVLNMQAQDLAKDHKILWKERMNEVDQAWLPTGKANKVTIPSGESKETEIITDAKRKMIKSSQQVIPEINFTQAHLRDVLQYLSKITGVNIILDERVFEGGAAPEPAPAAEPEKSDAGQGAIEAAKESSGPMTDTITISLSNIPLIEALRYILKIKGLKYRIDDYAIMVSTPEGIGDEEMETRYYHLSSGIGDFTEFKLNENATNTGGVAKGKGGQGGSSQGGGLGGEGLEVESKVSIKDVLLNSGVPFPPGSNVFMDKRTGTLIVHNTPENLAMVERILEIIDKPPFQINIQAKFVRINQSDLQELGFEWLLKSPIRVGQSVDGQNKWQINADTAFQPLGGTVNADSVAFNNALGDTALVGGASIKGPKNGIDTLMPNMAANSSLLSFSGLLTKPQFEVVMHALDKSGNADLLSAPSVTTVNNQQAQIELVDEIRYPNQYDLQAPVISDGKMTTAGMAVPGDFVTRNVGVILNVTPSVGSDRKTITLTLIPEVSELTGWHDYGVTYQNTVTDANTNQTTITSNKIPLEQPIFRTQNVSTSVVVNDGETVVLGGLIDEKKSKVHDKVPFLGDIPFIGRLFRHDYDQTQKMNLMIFVTAKLINADGEDLHPSKKATT